MGQPQKISSTSGTSSTAWACAGRRFREELILRVYARIGKNRAEIRRHGSRELAVEDLQLLRVEQRTRGAGKPRAVGRISEDRKSKIGEMDANLVGASGFWKGAHECDRRAAGFSARDDFELRVRRI